MGEFPISQKKIYKIETKYEININICGYGNKQMHPIHLSRENYEDQIESFLLKNKRQFSRLIKIFDSFI